MMFDTHAHLDYSDFDADRDAVLERAREAGVTRILTIGTSMASSRCAIRLAEQFDQIYAVVGIHPTESHTAEDGWLDELRQMAAHPRVVAIGETGLDYHRLPEDEVESALCRKQQAEVFRAQLDLAAETGLNLVFHQRDSWDDMLGMLENWDGRVRGVFHCFGGTPEQAQEIIGRGHMVSFTGIVTFKNAALVRETAAAVPPGSFMVETDCPYLAPVPHRGGRCEPAHTRLVAEKIAGLRGISLDEVSAITSAAAESFFKFNR